MYKEQAAEHYEGGILNAKRSKYNFALQDTEGERDDWTTALEECKERKEALKDGSREKALEQARVTEAKVAQEREALLDQMAQQEKVVLKQQQETKFLAEAATKVEVEVDDKTPDETVQEKENTLLNPARFIPNTWYDEQIEVAEQAEIAALEKIDKATTELEEAQKALKSIDDQVKQEENSDEAKSKLAAVKRRFQARLQELQAAGELADQKVQQCQDTLKACNNAAIQAKEAIQKAKEAKEHALKTTYLQFNEVGKDLVEGITLDRKKYDRDQRVLDATAKVDQERAENTKEKERLAKEAEIEKAAREKALEQKRMETQTLVEGKKREVDEAFSRARNQESESAWDEARQIANAASTYWNGVIEDIKAGRSPLSFTQEEATEQGEHYLGQEKTALEKATSAVQAQAQAQRIMAEKRRVVESAFARARAAKNERGWNEAQSAAMAASNYWNGIVESIKAGKNTLSLNEEEATFQKKYWMEKAGIAEVKALEAQPCSNGWGAKRDRADAMMWMISKKVWPCLSEAMKAFIAFPSEARMHYASACASACASVCASASASAYASASASASAYTYAYA